MDEATGIGTVETEARETAPQCYDLSGRRLSKPRKGINIANGRTFVAKQAAALATVVHIESGGLFSS